MMINGQRPSASNLRIAVVGVGAIGSAFAFQLARIGGHDVTTIARPGSRRLEQLLRDRSIVKTSGERVNVLVTDTLEADVPYDLVLVTVLAHQVEIMLPTLQRSKAKWIQFMFNNFEPEKLRDAIGAHRCSFGIPFIQASLDSDGKLNAKIGALGQKSRMNSRQCANMFKSSGLPSIFESDMLLWLRCHAPLAAAFESVSAAGMRRGGGASWTESLTIAQGMQECFTLIRRLGYRLYPAGKTMLYKNPAWLAAGIPWLMSRIRSFRELLAMGAKECDALVDVFLSKASRIQPPISARKILAMKPPPAKIS